MISKSALLAVSISAALLVLAAFTDTATAQRSGHSGGAQGSSGGGGGGFSRGGSASSGSFSAGGATSFFGTGRNAERRGEPLPGSIFRAGRAAEPLGGPL